MGLRERPWRRFLKAPDPELLTELYEPALREAVRYDRCCAYFSSSVLAAAARGFAPLVERLLALPGAPAVPPVRLLVNEELSRQDVDAMLLARGADALAERLAQRLLEPLDALERERLALLGLLVKRRLLDIKVGVMREKQGILHAKFGIITDAAGDALVFSGSGNESAAGLRANYEKLEVSGSWSDPERHQHYVEEFETLWAGDDSAVAVLTLPDAVRQRIIRYADDMPAPRGQPDEHRRRRCREAWMRWRFVLEAPWFPDGGASCDAMALDIGLWPHQIRVVEECAAAWPAGRLLCDEVGMGKTIEAIMILRRLLAGRGVRRALLLVPAGILTQWQGELREKGGLLVPRLEGQSTLVWPTGETDQRRDLAAALEEPLLLMSRETARLEQNAAVLMHARRWDLVLLDEAHAARRASQEETEFNSATLLLDLLRQFQLRGQARSLLLLSATPMQTHPWEPWDLLGVLGEGPPWLSDFNVVREFYATVSAATEGPVARERGQAAAEIVRADPLFPPLPIGLDEVPGRLLAAPARERADLARALRRGAPLGRRMHRNTRHTLRRYHERGLVKRPPATRTIQDVRFHFAMHEEREVYEGVQGYVERRFAELEQERPGKGFVMTVYRRRAASSPQALERSLVRRQQGLERVARGAVADGPAELEEADQQDLDELLDGTRTPRLPSSLPDDPVTARAELREVQRLLEKLRGLAGRDSKLERFAEALREATSDGRPCLVFSEFTDTVEYLRDALVPRYGDALACYTGKGGLVRDAGTWRSVSKDEITARLASNGIRLLLCSDAASEGLNLQTASALINYDLPWNPARVEQRIGRIDRIGQQSADLRIVNLILADSVDDRVYQVLEQRCDLFETFVGAMQPVLSVARQMLLGVRPFDAQLLEETARQAKADALAAAAFDENEEPPGPAEPPGVTASDLARSWQALRDLLPAAARHAAPPIALDSRTLQETEAAVPLSPFVPLVRRLSDALDVETERLPLVLAAAERDAFKVVVAAWAGGGRIEIIDRAGRLEALLGQWDGRVADDSTWQTAHAEARRHAEALVSAMAAKAAEEEQQALRRQVQAAEQRLRRELARFLACARENGEGLNQAFHRWMQRGGNTAVLLRRAYDLVGYPDWREAEVRQADMQSARLTANQRSNVLLGTPLEAAVRDPRWVARDAVRT